MQYIVFYILIFSIGSFFYLSSIKDELISLRNEVITMSNKQEPAKKVKNNKYPKGLTKAQHKARIETPIDLRKYKYFTKDFGEYVRDRSPTKQQYQIEGSKRGIIGTALKDAMFNDSNLFSDNYSDKKDKRERIKKVYYGTLGNNIAYNREANPSIDPSYYLMDVDFGYGDGSNDFDTFSFKNVPGVIGGALRVPYSYVNEEGTPQTAGLTVLARDLIKNIIEAPLETKNAIINKIKELGGDDATLSDLLREAIGSNMKIDNANAFLDFIKGYQFNDPRLAEMAEKYSQYEYDPNYVEGAEGTTEPTEGTNPSGYILDTSSADAIRKAMYGDTYGQALQSTKPVVNYDSGLTDEEAYRIGREMAIGVHGGR